MYPQLTLETIRARVQNSGSASQSNVPVRLFYHNIQQAEQLVSLAPGVIDTVVFPWTTPTLDTAQLKVQVYCPGDTIRRNDSLFTTVIIIKQPMHGQYDIGGGAHDYASFSGAVADMRLRGIDGAVTFNAYGTVYTERVTIDSVYGVSPSNTITFREAAAIASPVSITSSSVSGLAVVDNCRSRLCDF